MMIFMLMRKSQAMMLKFARDVDKLRDIKIFTYLTDVENEENGPFEILDNTHLFKLNKFKYLNKNNYRILDRNIPCILKK